MKKICCPSKYTLPCKDYQKHLYLSCKKINFINCRELAAKVNEIGACRKREEEYLSLISTLKLNLAKAKEGVKSNLSTTKELDCLKQKLIEQIKVSVYGQEFVIPNVCVFKIEKQIWI